VAAAQDLFTKKREESVEQQLPRLAYLLSDVIIFVDVVDAANKDVRTSPFPFFFPFFCHSFFSCSISTGCTSLRSRPWTASPPRRSRPSLFSKTNADKAPN
jgi:hypothetical protein